MATRRQQIDSRGKGLLQLLEDSQSEMANLMNPSAQPAGIYKGPNPDKPVDILYPKHKSGINKELGAYSNYFLREYNLDGQDMSQFGEGKSPYGTGSGILTQAENDGGASENALLANLATDVLPGGEKGYASKIRNKDKLWSQALGADGSNFMKKKGRKSLLTLYWEMRGAFVNDESLRGFHWGPGQDGANKTFTNTYTGDGSQTYNDSFSRHTLDYYYPPAGDTDVATAAANGFNLGQVLGPDISVQNSLKEKGIALARSFIDRMLNFLRYLLIGCHSYIGQDGRERKFLLMK